MRIVALISLDRHRGCPKPPCSASGLPTGLRREGPGASQFPPALIFGHPVLAATGLVIWIL
jgi:hypothetical protein